jgi:hypothetical protein
MITITRKDKICKVSLEDGPLDYTFYFNYECSDDVHAELLRVYFNKKITDRIEDVRKQEYERGYKDGRAKVAKASWFSCLLKNSKYWL